MSPKFKIDKSRTIHITNEFICDGHWLITLKAALSLKEFKPWLRLKNGLYENGLHVSDKTAERKYLIPDFADKGQRLSVMPHRVEFIGEMDIGSYVFNSIPRIGEIGFEIAIQPVYAPIYNLGPAYAESNFQPISIWNGHEFLALVMPTRISAAPDEIGEDFDLAKEMSEDGALD